jgi:cytochrome P450
VLSHADLFSSDAMQTMFLSSKPGAATASDPEVMGRMIALAQALPFTIEEMATARNLIATDPPVHEVLRKIVSRGFTPRRIAAYEERVRAIVATCVARLRRGEPFDVVRDLAIPVPTVIIAEMLGVEPERQADFRRWSEMVISQSTGSRRSAGADDSEYIDTISELSRYLAGVIDERRRASAEDLVTALVAAQDGEGTLTPMEVVSFIILLLVAGNETTTNLIGNAVNALLAHPEQLERVRRDRNLVPAVVEETLRWEGPIQFLFRRVRREVQVGGVTLPVNAIVMPLIGSANRDETVFANAARYDIGRDTSGSLAFGIGVHFCLGAALARLEARVAVGALVDELAGLQRVEPRIEYIDSFLIRGPRSLTLAPRTSA